MRRPLFQFHLSTAIVLMFVASLLLWVNVSPPDMRLETGDCPRPGAWGWPLSFPDRYDTDAPAWSILATNAAIAVAVLMAYAFVCEYVTCRPRPTLKLRLATVALVVLGAAAGIGANSYGYMIWSATGFTGSLQGWACGWPCWCYTWHEDLRPGTHLVTFREWYWLGLVTDLLVWLSILLSLAVTSELILRRVFPAPAPPAKPQTTNDKPKP
ncbi:MAG: hypothetical protein NTW87_04275 [Planctomycetota bacterium]|nr:hypothetical protein [Planctomycetota bacterium]